MSTRNQDNHALTAKSTSVPTQKVVVTQLSKPLHFRGEGEKKREVWECPFGNNCDKYKKGVSLDYRMFRRPTNGFGNLYQHLATCAGGKDKLLQLYYEALAKNNIARSDGEGVEVSGGNGDLRQYFNADSLQPEVVELYHWLNWIVMKDMPFNAVEDSHHRAMVMHKMHHSTKTLLRVLHGVVALVEEKIAGEILLVKENGGKAAIMYDGWTSVKMEHYVGLFLSYCVPTRGRFQNKWCTIWVPKVVLISCSTMDHETATAEGEVINAAVTFNAQQHIEYFEYALGEYGITFEDNFITNQICDNAAVNLKIGRVLGIPTVGCNNHKLNLEVEKFVRENCAKLIECVRRTMAALKNCQTLRDRLRNKTHLQPVVYNETRWSGKLQMLQKWLRIHQFCEVINQEISMDPNAGPNTRTIPMFVPRGIDPHHMEAEVKKYAKFLSHFENTHKKMQTSMITLAECRNQLDGWVVKKENAVSNDTSNELFLKLELKYIKADSSIVKNADFESGVVKIQNKEIDEMNQAERFACSKLRKEVLAANIPVAAAPPHIDTRFMSPSGIADSTKRKRQRLEETMDNSYINCDYILGSVAEVERLWSLCKNVLTDHRSCIKPMNLEALMFLKINSTYWDVNTVNEAIGQMRAPANPEDNN